MKVTKPDSICKMKRLKFVASSLKGKKVMAAISVTQSSSRKPVIQGGVVKVQINRVSDAQGVKSISIKKASSSSKSTCGIFVAGGAKIDRIVASANEHVTTTRK